MTHPFFDSKTPRVIEYLKCLLLSGIVAAGCSGGSNTGAADTAKPVVEVLVASAKKGDIQVTLSVTGVLSPLPDHEAKIAPLAAGRIKRVFVKTGDTVTKGQIVATLDPGAAAGQVRQAEASVHIAEATLNQARVNYTSQTRSQKAAIDQALLNVRAQQVALDKLKAGLRPQEIAQAEASVASAQAALTNAEQNLSRALTLFSQGLLARKDLEAAQAQEQTAKAALATAELARSMAKQGSRPEDIRAGEVALAQARQQLRAAESQSIQNAAKAEDVRIAAGQLNAARGALESALAQSRSLTILSPLAGTVVGRTVNAGEAVDVTTAIATVVNLDQLKLLLNVPADQIGKVSNGNGVDFSVDANPGVTRHATVTTINRAVDPQTNTVPVEALVSNADRSLRDDGFVRAEIVVQHHQDAILVPATSVVDRDGKPTIYLAGSDGIAHAVEVEIGARNAGSVEVLSGVSVGAKVVTTGAFELDDKTQIKVVK